VIRRRDPIRHQPIADACRQAPGEWREVGPYPARYSAQSTARAIRVAQLPAYKPAGSFDSEVRTGPAGDPTVWARYTAGGAE
jgi:hypothetical protein